MNFKTIGLKAAVATAVVAGSAMTISPAQAASVTYNTASFSFNQDTDFSTSNVVGSSSLPYFNSALGTLNSITYQFLGDATASVTLTNNSTKKDGQGYAGSSIYGYASSLFNGYNAVGASASVNGTVAKNGGSLTDTQTNNGSYQNPYSFTDSSYLAAATSTGSYGVDFIGYLSSYYGSNSGGNALTRSTLDVEAAITGLQARVTYDYTPTAVPTPALLPGLLAMGVGILRKRKAEATEEIQADA